MYASLSALNAATLSCGPSEFAICGQIFVQCEIHAAGCRKASMELRIRPFMC
jgi:hypothetical protein